MADFNDEFYAPVPTDARVSRKLQLIGYEIFVEGRPISPAKPK